jgi:nicotinate-nucleotide adenylyltransferase
MTASRIALYGGTFDPIHFGHLIVARAVGEMLGLDRVVFLPTARPPHKEGLPLADVGHRATMVQLALEGEPGLTWDRFDMDRPGPTYSIDTVLHFHKREGPGAALHWIVGADALADLPSWKRIGELVEQCQLVVAARATALIEWDRLRGSLSDEQIQRLRRGLLITPVIEISSTEIRRRVSEGKSIRFLVPEAVHRYIQTQGLYRPAPAAPGH